MRRNPKTAVAPWVDELLPIEMRNATKHQRPIYVTFEWDEGRRWISTVPGHGGLGRSIAMIVPTLREIIVMKEDFFQSPTLVHALHTFLSPRREMFAGYEMTEFGEWPGGSSLDRIEAYDTGYTVDRFLDEIRIIQEESTVRSGRHGENEEVRTFEYLALQGPKDIRWYHATLRENLDSIATYGLRPSSLSEDRKEGWSPGWNINLQRAVYLTSSLSYAVRIAYTIATRSGKDAAVISVAGSGLSDTKLLTYDEDALRSDLDDSVIYGDYDIDFPQWVTSAEHRVRSVAYRGTIAPSAIRLVAVAKYAVETFQKPYSDDPEDVDHEVDIRWVGSNAVSEAGDWGRPLKEALAEAAE